MQSKIKTLLTKNPWVQCPMIPQVQDVINNVQITDFVRGSGKARKRLDELESRYRLWVKDIIDLKDFHYCYFVNGVTDALNQWIATEDRPWQFLQGDYEYAHMISGKGNKVSYINSSDVLYVSNPACSTGNFINLKDIPNPVILDCAYIGSTQKNKIMVPENTEQIWFSFSKGWGIVGQRSGLVFSKLPHKSLDIMKNVEAWNYTAVETSLAIVDNFDIDTTYNMYRDKQIEVCKKYNLDPSDCFFIANTTNDEFKERRRISKIARLDISKLL
tara:strand:+ start:2211 stop:3029 length:819 start_codon:yes stop_codon:yes gene_type:complete